MTKRKRMHEMREEAGAQDPPPARPEFVRDLESRLGSSRIVAAAPVTRGPWRAIGAVAAAAMILAAVLVLRADDDPAQQVTTDPTTSSSTVTTSTTTSSTVVSPTTSIVEPTTVVAPITTTTTSAPTTTTTTAPPPETTTTTVEPTTTTSTTEVPAQDLGLVCVTREGSTTVVCEWDTSTSPEFDHFRLWKHTGDGPDQEVYRGTDRRYEDTERVGARMFYEVTALDASGRVLGHGESMITCC
jgi:hypothetical protein